MPRWFTFANDRCATEETAMDGVGHAVGALAPMSLDEVDQCAALQTRIDRKYVVPEATAMALLAALGDRAAVLAIGGRRSFRYESTYFDTDDLASYLGAAHGRPRRFKVRSRVYRDQGTCVLEVKTRSGRGHTVKQRMPYRCDDRERLTPSGAAFVDDRVGEPGLGARLRPVLRTAYLRTTVVDLADGCRITVDRQVSAADPAGATARLDGHAVVETKSPRAATAADRWLWQHGCRPARFSKFCVGLAALHPCLPANAWNRVLRRYYRWVPARKGMGPSSTPSRIRPAVSRCVSFSSPWLAAACTSRNACSIPLPR